MRKLLSGLIVLSFLLALPIGAKAEVLQLTRAKPFGKWALKCGKAKTGPERCVLTLSVKSNTQQLLGVSIQKNGNKKRIHFSVPLGISLKHPVKFRLDRRRQKSISLVMCDPNGCHGSLLLDKTLMRAIKKGKQASVIYKLPDGRELKVPCPFDGVAKGVRQVK